MKGMSWTPKGFGGERADPEAVKREGWNRQGILVVNAEDERLTWPEREIIRQIGERLYGEKEGKRA